MKSRYIVRYNIYNFAMYPRCILGIIITITVINAATLTTPRLTINIIVIKKVRKAGDGGFVWGWEGKEGMTMVAESQLTVISPQAHGGFLTFHGRSHRDHVNY